MLWNPMHSYSEMQYTVYVCVCERQRGWIHHCYPLSNTGSPWFTTIDLVTTYILIKAVEIQGKRRQEISERDLSSDIQGMPMAISW